MAARLGYTLEWKVYGHDGPANLVESLLAAGFEPDDEEQVLVCRFPPRAGRRQAPAPWRSQ